VSPNPLRNDVLKADDCDAVPEQFGTYASIVQFCDGGFY
jgi:hypothetical protein